MLPMDSHVLDFGLAKNRYDQIIIVSDVFGNLFLRSSNRLKEFVDYYQIHILVHVNILRLIVFI